MWVQKRTENSNSLLDYDFEKKIANFTENILYLNGCAASLKVVGTCDAHGPPYTNASDDCLKT